MVVLGGGAVSYERGTPACGGRTPLTPPAAEQGGNNLNDFNDFRTKNGSSQEQYMALNGLFVPSSPDSGRTRSSAPEGDARHFRALQL